MAEPYKRLQENQQELDADNIKSFIANATSSQKSRRLKMYNAMVLLSFAEFALGLLIFLLGITCSSVRESRGASCTFGTAIWVGVLCLITGCLGVAALRVPEGRKGFLVSYLVLCIFSCIADGVLMIFSSIWISMNTFTSSKAYNIRVTIVCLNVVLVIVSFSHMLISIISTAFICYNWNCCEKKPGVVIFYVPQSLVNGNHPENVEFLKVEGIETTTKPVVA